MAEVTWKATFLGAFILFLIGVVVATCLNYALPAYVSIKAGISGPYECIYNPELKNSRIERNILCKETGFDKPQKCVYILVSYQVADSKEIIRDIKLTPNYRYDNNDTAIKPAYTFKTTKGDAKPLGRVSTQ